MIIQDKIILDNHLQGLMNTLHVMYIYILKGPCLTYVTSKSKQITIT